MERKKRSKKKAVGEDFSEWLETSGKRDRPNVWDTMPPEALAELNAVIAHNDKNPDSRVPAHVIMRRLYDTHGVKFGHTTLIRYCRKALGRTSWSEA